MSNRFIEKLNVINALSSDDVTALVAATSRPRKFSGRRDIIREGDTPGPVIVVLDGWACRYKILPDGARQILAFMMPGDSCDLHAGLMAEMDHSIGTITPSLIAMIDRVEMETILDDRRAVAKAMYLSQLIDEGVMRAWITSIGRRSSIERVAHLMCELYRRARNIGLASGTAFELPLSQLLLADAMGMTPVHLNRVLRTLRVEGAMTLLRGSVIITDPLQLARIAGFDENYLHRKLRTDA